MLKQNARSDLRGRVHKNSRQAARYVLSSLSAGGCFSMVSFQECFAGLNNGAVLRPPTSGASKKLINFFGVFIYISVGSASGMSMTPSKTMQNFSTDASLTVFLTHSCNFPPCLRGGKKNIYSNGQSIQILYKLIE